MDLASIEYMSYEKMAEVIKLFTGIELTRQNLFYIIDSNFNHYSCECMGEIQEQLNELGINPGEAVHYDEELIWISHQPQCKININRCLKSNCYSRLYYSTRKFQQELYKNVFKHIT